MQILYSVKKTSINKCFFHAVRKRQKDLSHEQFKNEILLTCGFIHGHLLTATAQHTMH